MFENFPQILRACCCINEIRRIETDLAYRDHLTQQDPDLGCCYKSASQIFELRNYKTPIYHFRTEEIFPLPSEYPWILLMVYQTSNMSITSSLRVDGNVRVG